MIEEMYRRNTTIFNTILNLYDCRLQSIFLRDYPESAGAGLLSPNSGNNLGVEIAKFIRYKIVAKSDQMPWVNYQKSE